MSLFLVPGFLAHGGDGRGSITSMWREVGYTSGEVKCVTLLPDRENYPLRLLVEGDGPVLLLCERNDFRNSNLLGWSLRHADSVGRCAPLLARGDGCASLGSCGKVFPPRPAGCSFQSSTKDLTFLHNASVEITSEDRPSAFWRQGRGRRFRLGLQRMPMIFR